MTTAASRYIADSSKDVIYLRNVKPIFRVGYNRLVDVQKGVMDGNIVALRMPHCFNGVGYGGSTEEIVDVSVPFCSSNKQGAWLMNLC